MKNFEARLKALMKNHETLLKKKNEPTEYTNGLFNAIKILSSLPIMLLCTGVMI